MNDTPLAREKEFAVLWIHDTRKMVVAVEDFEKLERNLGEAKVLLQVTQNLIPAINQERDQLRAELEKEKALSEKRWLMARELCEVLDAILPLSPAVIKFQKMENEK